MFFCLFLVIRPGDLIVAEGSLQLLRRNCMISLTKCLEETGMYLAYILDCCFIEFFGYILKQMNLQSTLQRP